MESGAAHSSYCRCVPGMVTCWDEAVLAYSLCIEEASLRGVREVLLNYSTSSRATTLLFPEERWDIISRYYFGNRRWGATRSVTPWQSCSTTDYRRETNLMR